MYQAFCEGRMEKDPSQGWYQGGKIQHWIPSTSSLLVSILFVRLTLTGSDASFLWFSELWFYDNYVIPLALKLIDCGVFGASGDEYHTYAVNNRNEWAERGKEICRDMVDKAEEIFASDDRYFM